MVGLYVLVLLSHSDYCILALLVVGGGEEAQRIKIIAQVNIMRK